VASRDLYSPAKKARRKTAKSASKKNEDDEDEDEGERDREEDEEEEESEPDELGKVLDYESDEEFQDAPSQYLNISGIDPKSIVFEGRRPKTSGSSPKMMDYSSVVPVGMTSGEILPQINQRLVESVMGKLKVDRIRQMHGKMLNHTKANLIATDPSSIIMRHPTLSIYDAQNKTPTTYRPFSAVYNRINDNTMRKDQLAEIEDVKKKLGKFRINVPMRTLATSLLIPDKVAKDKLLPLPTPGNSLLKNPFFKEKKGKKKKKKKKA